jgi:hypothetical protein
MQIEAADSGANVDVSAELLEYVGVVEFNVATE